MTAYTTRAASTPGVDSAAWHAADMPLVCLLCDRWELWTNLMPYNGMSNVTVLAQVLSGAEVRPHVPGEGGAPAIEPPSPRWAELMRCAHTPSNPIEPLSPRWAELMRCAHTPSNPVARHPIKVCGGRAGLPL